jgi:hypothetical protein
LGVKIAWFVRDKADAIRGKAARQHRESKSAPDAAIRKDDARDGEGWRGRHREVRHQPVQRIVAAAGKPAGPSFPSR